MHRQIRTRLVWGICIVLGFTFCAPVDDAPVEPGGDYDDLVELFLEFRELQEVKITDWVPDYTPAALEAQRRGLQDFQRRLNAMDVIGKLAINQMIAERVRQLGDEFSYKDFFEDFFSAGLIPLSLIRWQMTGLDDQIEILLQSSEPFQ